MACGCGRSEDGCRGWHALTEEEYQLELEAYKQAKDGNYRVTEVEHYTDSLFKFKLNKPVDFVFKAGQFTMISVEDAPKRAYSMTSGPEDNFLEFFSIKVPNGPLTSKLQKIQPGDYVSVSNKATGTLIIDNLTEGTDLWLLATGTGIAPFISMLSDPKTHDKFKTIHIFWSVRDQNELLAFDSWLDFLNIDYIPIVTRDSRWEGENRRITTLLEEGKVFPTLNPDNDNVMICGNMDFNKEIKKILESKGYIEGSNRKKGSLVLEKAFVG